VQLQTMYSDVNDDWPRWCSTGPTDERSLFGPHQRLPRGAVPVTGGRDEGPHGAATRDCGKRLGRRRRDARRRAGAGSGTGEGCSGRGRGARAAVLHRGVYRTPDAGEPAGQPKIRVAIDEVVDRGGSGHVAAPGSAVVKAAGRMSTSPTPPGRTSARSWSPRRATDCLGGGPLGQGNLRPREQQSS
jgi:hypothetical protein